MHFVTNCVFQLNERYELSEISDKPSQISEINHILQSAAQTWLFATHLPLLIGDFVPEDRKHWHCFRLLLKIRSITASWKVSPTTIEYLTILTRAPPPLKIFVLKMHYMVHYPSTCILMDNAKLGESFTSMETLRTYHIKLWQRNITLYFAII